MSHIVAERVSRTRISDPPPTRCAACLRSADPSIRFVDFDAAIDRGAIVDKTTAAVIDSIDELHLCEQCVREAAETLDYRPGLHMAHLRLNRELMADHDRLERENRQLRQLLAGE